MKMVSILTLNLIREEMRHLDSELTHFLTETNEEKDGE